MKELLVSLVSVGIIASSCGAPTTTEPKEKVPVTYQVKDSVTIGGQFVHATINGMPCIVWLESQGSNKASWGRGGLTCDWSREATPNE